MNLPNQYRRVRHGEGVEDAVKVTIFDVAGQTTGLIWHPPVRSRNGVPITPKVDFLPADKALDAAIERLFVLRPFGFRQIVVRLEQEELWDPAWGELI
jgi:hypothetical protein